MLVYVFVAGILIGSALWIVVDGFLQARSNRPGVFCYDYAYANNVDDIQAILVESDRDGYQIISVFPYEGKYVAIIRRPVDG